MIRALLANLTAFVMAAPTNIVILLVLAIILKFLGWSLGKCIKFVIAYFLIAFLLAIFGYNMPSFATIWGWIVSVWNSLVAIFW